jgi:hypothetical protein
MDNHRQRHRIQPTLLYALPNVSDLHVGRPRNGPKAAAAQHHPAVLFHRRVLLA